jgi:hypothetical protein
MGLFSKSDGDSRRADGKPETKADRKFFDLRESGWKGAIDRNGDAVMGRTDSKGKPLGLFSKR